ncbi:hypothetical protein lerEdw1_016286 [Lerista edwardsae]|nr:hypothetical protein lerEdw1_016286 [Lerista edwardsae]
MHGPRSRESADWTRRRLPWRSVGESQRPADYTASSWSRQCRSGDCLGVEGSTVCTRDLPARRICRQGCDSRARTDRAKMPQTRMRMRAWLEMEIESNKIPGLIWINKNFILKLQEEKLFQIPWKHAAKHGWELEKDACLFRNWAIHTGRYKKGEVQPDPKTWKANFRCAMNSLPDIEEVKDKSISKGSTAVRVYRMLPTSAKSQKKEKKPKIKTVKKSAEDIKTEEAAEATNSIQLPDDHSGYVLPSYSQEAMEAENASLSLGLSACDMNSSLTEWRRPLDIAVPDSTNDMYSFQVSPITSSSDGWYPVCSLSADWLIVTGLRERRLNDLNTVELVA